MPSQLLAEDPLWVQKMKLVLQTKNEWEKEKARRQSRGARAQ